MFKTVIFDLDGTLLDTIEDLARCGIMVCQRHGWKTHSISEYKYFVGNGIPKLVERFSPPDKRSPEILSSTLKEYRELYELHKEDLTAPYKGIDKLLDELVSHGIAIGVFSNKDDKMARSVVSHYFPDLECKVRGRIDNIPPKPDPKGLWEIMRDMNADKNSTLFVGDSNVDILTAKNGLIPSCGVLWGFRTKDELLNEGADFIAENPQELLNIILQKEL